MAFEELDLELDELETIEKFNNNFFDYPVVHVGKFFIYFNRIATPLVPKYIKWSVSTEYVIGLPADEDDKNAFKTRNPSNQTNCYQAAFPARLKHEKKLQIGNYKLYKYKDGFAFKRYERIGEG